MQEIRVLIAGQGWNRLKQKMEIRLPLDFDSLIRTKFQNVGHWNSVVQTHPLAGAITIQGLFTLHGHEWVSDMSMNYYIQLLNARNRQRVDSDGRRTSPNTWILNSFFYTKLNSAGYDGVKNWTKPAIVSCLINLI